MRFFWRSRMLSMSSRVFWNTFCGKSPSRKTFGMALYQRRRKKHKTCGRQGGSKIEDIRDGVVLEKKKETQDVWQVGWEQDRRHSGWRCTRAEGRNTRRVAGRVGVGQKTFGMALYQRRRKKHKTCGRQGGSRIEDIRDGVVLEQKEETQDVWQVGWEQDRRHSGWRCTRAEGRNTRRVAGRVGVGQKTFGMALYQRRRKKHKTCGRQGGSRIEGILNGIVLEQKEETQDQKTYGRQDGSRIEDIRGGVVLEQKEETQDQKTYGRQDGSRIEDIRNGVVLEQKEETQDVWQVGQEQDRRHPGWRCTRAEGRNTRRVAGRIGVGQKTFGMALYQSRRKKHKTCGRQDRSRIEVIRDGMIHHRHDNHSKDPYSNIITCE